MGFELISIEMKILIFGSLNLDRHKDLDNIFGKMETFIMDNLKMDSKMDMVFS